MTEETKPEAEQPKGGNGKVPEDQPEEKDFKIAEIWLRDGDLQLDGSAQFWSDKVRALGVLEYAKDIVKQYQAPKAKIIQPKGQMMDFVRKKFSKRGK